MRRTLKTGLLLVALTTVAFGAAACGDDDGEVIVNPVWPDGDVVVNIDAAVPDAGPVYNDAWPPDDALPDGSNE